ncbi:GntR family transcriptional regulator [Ramlibacter alkalitolerans]|uniref:GntR family transcriptional regulator n=1 Tax=Ramlibacter alkalitolerans TaxID=2039631 RepID=A0ABS1JIH7_9BURK|nr:GntR family transcriptional regulator [Ramlibacter alkalitolerans]MBL0424030.1 GntR family transcriptional regulator [Ramlibacter alkalitolerans]
MPAETTPSSSPVNELDRYAREVVPGLAKYAQLRETLSAAIRGGYWKPGSQLPPERELVRLTRFSLGTVQRALRDLADQGLLVRTQGSGTYVAEGRGSIEAPLYLRFLGREGEPRFLPLFPSVLSRKSTEERGPWSVWLRQTSGAVIRITRRISVNGEFNLFNCFYFRADAFPGIAQAPLATLDGADLKQMLGGESNMPVTEMHQRVSFVKFSAEAAEGAGVKVGTRGMLLESAALAGREPLYYLESFIPPNDRRLDVSAS